MHFEKKMFLIIGEWKKVTTKIKNFKSSMINEIEEDIWKKSADSEILKTKKKRLTETMITKHRKKTLNALENWFNE